MLALRNERVFPMLTGSSAATTTTASTTHTMTSDRQSSSAAGQTNAIKRDLTSWWRRFNMRMRKEEEKGSPQATSIAFSCLRGVISPLCLILCLLSLGWGKGALAVPVVLLANVILALVGLTGSFGQDKMEYVFVFLRHICFVPLTPCLLYLCI
jgi:Flp pilus assembly protein TadB